MSTAQRFAWLDGLSTVAVCGLAIAVLPPEAPATAWGMAARIAAVTLVCIIAFYYNDLYNFEVPHDLGQLFRRLCRALGLSASGTRARLARILDRLRTELGDA